MLGDRRKAMLIKRKLFANLTKREFVDLSKVNDSLYGMVFPALLWGGDHDNPVFGRWAGDQVVLIADWDISFSKALRLARSLKLHLPCDVVNELWKGREYETLDRFVWRHFNDITDEVIRALSPVDPEEVRRGVKAVWY
jgi:hypothetical protein